MEAFPFDKVVEFSSTKFSVENLVKVPFQLVLNEYWLGRRMSFARVWTLGWLKEGKMEDWMNFPLRREFELEGSFEYN